MPDDTTPTPPDPHTDDVTTPEAMEAIRLETELRRVKQERDEFHSELDEVHDEIVSRLPNPDDVLAENNINTLLDTAQLLSVAYDVWTENLHEEAEEAKARHERINAKRLERAVADVNTVREVIAAAVSERGYMDDGLETALQITDRLLVNLVARAINDFAPPDDFKPDDVPF